jgi:hypothetical protein
VFCVTHIAVERSVSQTARKDGGACSSMGPALHAEAGDYT